MTRKWLLMMLGILVVLSGCENGTSPTEPMVIESRQIQDGEAALADDTATSEILTTPYRAYVFAALGDSITFGEGADFNGYPKILENRLRELGYNATISNKGIPGAYSGEIADRFNRDTVGADIVLIMVGTNDISAPSDDEPYYNQTIANIRRMIQKAQMAGIVPILGTITPNRAGDIYARFNPDIEAINAQIFALGAEYNLAVVDTYSAILNNGGNILFADKHHFTDEGYSVIANEWKSVLTTRVLYQIQ